MRKGDLKRLEIMEAAERFFCAKGYEETSVQEIIDATHSSKGGFYHYFISKEALLDALCAQHAQRAAEETAHQLENEQETVGRLNILFAGMMPLQGTSKSFMNMLLPVLAKPEGLSVLVRWQEELIQAFVPMLSAEIAAGKKAGVLFPVASEVTRPVLLLVNQCWREAVVQVIEGTKAHEINHGAIADLLKNYRKIICALLDAPYGSIQLADVTVWDNLIAELADAFGRAGMPV